MSLIATVLYIIVVGEESDVCNELFYDSLLQESQTTQEYLLWYLGCAFELDEAGDFLRISQRAFTQTSWTPEVAVEAY